MSSINIRPSRANFGMCNCTVVLCCCPHNKIALNVSPSDDVVIYINNYSCVLMNIYTLYDGTYVCGLFVTYDSV
jgi:hypothetical protein